MSDEGTPPPVLAAANMLQEARQAAERAKEALRLAATLGIAGAGGEHTGDALTAIREAIDHVEKAIKFHAGSN